MKPYLPWLPLVGILLFRWIADPLEYSSAQLHDWAIYQGFCTLAALLLIH